MKTIIMTIRARHFNHMAKGMKSYELRKTRPSAALPVHVLLCISGTGGEICGSFICREIEDATEWGAARLAKAAHITTDEAEGYRKKGKGKVYAWKVDDFGRHESVIGLNIADYDLTRTPQSWCYAKERAEG